MAAAVVSLTAVATRPAQGSAPGALAAASAPSAVTVVRRPRRLDARVYRRRRIVVLIAVASLVSGLVLAGARLASWAARAIPPTPATPVSLRPLAQAGETSATSETSETAGFGRAEDVGMASARSTYVVQPGDSLWSIARRLAPPEADPRLVVHQLRDRVGTTRLEPGQQLDVDGLVGR